MAPLAELAQEPGLGSGIGRNASIVRTLVRLHVFQLAQLDDARDALAVYRQVPPQARRHLQRLPDRLVEHHLSEHEPMVAAR